MISRVGSTAQLVACLQTPRRVPRSALRCMRTRWNADVSRRREELPLVTEDSPPLTEGVRQSRETAASSSRFARNSARRGEQLCPEAAKFRGGSLRMHRNAHRRGKVKVDQITAFPETVFFHEQNQFGERGFVAVDDRPPQAAPRRRPHRVRAVSPGDPGYVPVAASAFASVQADRIPRPGCVSLESTSNDMPPLVDDLCFVFEDFGPQEKSTKAISPDGIAVLSQRASGNAAFLQAQLSGAVSAGRVFEIVSRHLEEMDSLHVATALHRLARHAPRVRQAAVQFGGDPLVASLIQRLADVQAFDQLSSQGCCCTLWAIARLRTSAPWLPNLLNRCSELARSFSSHQIATAMHALTKIESWGSSSDSQTALLQALHEELRRRQQSLGPGGTSALDAVLIVDALSRLQIRDDALFGSLAVALLGHLQAGSLEVREVRHISTAFAFIGFVDADLSAGICEWLAPRVSSCTSGDLATIAGALARVNSAASSEHARFFLALQAEVLARSSSSFLRAKDAGNLWHAFSQAGFFDEALSEALAYAVGRSPHELNGQDLALVVPCFGVELGRKHSGIVNALATQAVRCARVLSPKQLARLACGFGGAGARNPLLWDALRESAEARASLFAIPDVLRTLAGFDAGGMQDAKVLRVLWGIVEGKCQKFLAEECLDLLRLWPRLDPTLRREKNGVPCKLLDNLRIRMEGGSRGGWQAPPEFAAELLEWMPQSRELNERGLLDARLVRTSMRQLPDQIAAAAPEVWLRLLAALGFADGELLVRSRSELQQRAGLHRAFMAQVVLFQEKEHDVGLCVSTAFRCAALGFDGPPVRELLRALLRTTGTEETRSTGRLDMNRAAQLCWACAEIRIHKRDALELASRFGMSGSMSAGCENDDADGNPVSVVRLAWASLALGGSEDLVRALTQAAVSMKLDGRDLLDRLTQADVRPARQLAWHGQQLCRGASSVHWTKVILAYEPWGHFEAADDKRLSELLQQMRVPHIASTNKAVQGSIYHVPAWFPEPNAVIDVDTRGDRLASGSLGGVAELRRQQLQEAGLRVHSLDAAVLRTTSRSQRLRAVAEAVASSCPEAVTWLNCPDALAAVDADTKGGRLQSPL